MTGQPAYTDADVQAMAEMLLANYASEYSADHLSWRDFEAEARGLLDAVAPAIAARALREAAERAYDESPVPPGRSGLNIAWLDDWLRARADHIEAG